MKNSPLILLIILFTVFNVHAQNYYDSLIGVTQVDKLEGAIPTFYTPGKMTIAEEFQQTITDAIQYYSKNSATEYALKLAVLDSAQWPHNRVPFGYVFYSQGWIFLNTGMNYGLFKKTYGLEAIYNQLDSALTKSGVSSAAMIKSFYKVYAVHELGHYYLSKISNARSPDRWTNEFAATYFAYHFFKTYNKSALDEFELFHLIHKDYYNPSYTSIEDFNTVYMKMGVENYLWYHSNFYFLVKSLHNCYGAEFIAMFEELFPKSVKKDYETSAIIELLEKNCESVVENWVEALEANSTKD